MEDYLKSSLFQGHYSYGKGLLVPVMQYSKAMCRITINPLPYSLLNLQVDWSFQMIKSLPHMKFLDFSKVKTFAAYNSNMAQVIKFSFCPKCF